jgi:formylglycine-generating enzyme required for sulfatase activity
MAVTGSTSKDTFSPAAIEGWLVVCALVGCSNVGTRGASDDAAVDGVAAIERTDILSSSDRFGGQDIADAKLNCGTTTGRTIVTADMCSANQIFIPGGSFMMGQSQFDGIAVRGRPEEEPVHKVTLSPYCIDRTEVSVAAYSLCVEAGECTVPEGDPYTNWNVPGREQNPVNEINWSQADVYCKWTGGSLPTEAQWEFAARGTDGRHYPWGDTPEFLPTSFPSDLFCENLVESGGTADVDSYPGGASPFGLLNMAGNVEEWVDDNYVPYTEAEEIDPVHRWPCAGSLDYDLFEVGVLRGPGYEYGGIYGNNLDPRAARRIKQDKILSMNYSGFRCARSAADLDRSGS